MRKEAATDVGAPVKRSLLLKCALTVGVLALAVTLPACREGSATSNPPIRQQGSTTSDNPTLLATIGDEKITMENVRARNGDLLDELDAQYRQTRDKLIGSTLDTIIKERLLTDEAQKQGKSPADLVAAAITAAGEPSEVEIAAWYKDNQERIGNRTLEEVRPQILALLQRERRTGAAEKLEQRLRTERKVTVSFEPRRLEFVNDGAPTRGAKDAPVTLVEFSDFQCPFCQAAAPTLRQVEQKYGDKVQIVYRQFPLTNIHQFAFKAAEASLCANEQGKFWDLHDLMFKEQNKLAVSDLKEKAARLGLDQKKFNNCLDSGRYVEQVQNDLKQGKSVGVTGTPAMFLNGVYVEGGAVPLSVLSTQIDKELARKAR